MAHQSRPEARRAPSSAVGSPSAGLLAGRAIVVTRARTQASDLATRLADLGAEPLEVAAIAIEEPVDGGVALRRSLARLEDYDWLVVTSTNGAEKVVAALSGRAPTTDLRIAAVGPRTAEVLERAGVRVDLQPERAVSESLVTAFPPGRGSVLLAVAEATRDVIESGLARLGWTVDRVVAYRTVGTRPSAHELAALARADAITFTSSSTVARLLEHVAVTDLPPVVACIGPITAATAQAAGVEVNAVADQHTIDGLIMALVAVYVPDHEAG